MWATNENKSEVKSSSLENGIFVYSVNWQTCIILDIFCKEFKSYLTVKWDVFHHGVTEVLHLILRPKQARQKLNGARSYGFILNHSPGKSINISFWFSACITKVARVYHNYENPRKRNPKDELTQTKSRFLNSGFA